MTQSKTADDLVDALDAKYDRWDVYRSALGRWTVKLPDTPLDRSTLTAALEAAIAYVPLPKYPRRPRLLSLDLFEPYKSGSAWRLRYDGDDFGVLVRTKYEANDVASRFTKRSQSDVEEWEREYGPLVAGKTPDVEFRWSD